MLLEAMAAKGKGLLEILQDLEKRYGKWIYARRDIDVPMEQSARAFDRLKQTPPAEILGVPIIEVKTIDGVKLIDRSDSWLLFRRSGTEPIVRVYAESPSAARVKKLLDYGVELIKKA